MPIGSKGLAMIDTRDIAEIAAIELLNREQAPDNSALTRLNWRARKHSPENRWPPSGAMC